MNRRPILIILLLTLITLAVFRPVLNNGFVSFDDLDYITGNTLVRRGLSRDGFCWAFTSIGYSANWHPLTWISHMTDVELFGLDPAGHHLTSLLIHLANTILLFLVLRSMTGALWRSAFAAALFAVHPMHVESVAWVSERKDVLSALFWLLTMAAYLRYVRKPGRAAYLAVILLYMAGLMAKPMVMTLPLVLLVLDFWPLGRLGIVPADGESGPARGFAVRDLYRLLIEKLPLLAASVVSAALTLAAQEKMAAFSLTGAGGLWMRLNNALVSYMRYIIKMIWPGGLAVLYPFRPLPAWQGLLAACLIVAVTAITLSRARKEPFLPAGWLWYTVTLLPVIGIVQVGSQAMADRYTYLPFIGLFVIVSWGADALVRRRSYKRVAAIVMAGVLAVFMKTAFVQVGYWHDSITLYRRAVTVTSGNWLSHNNLGSALAAEGEIEEAAYHFRESLRINPGYHVAHYNLGNAYAGRGKFQEALGHYRAALDIEPAFMEARYSMGSTFLRLGRNREAIDSFTRVIESDPGAALAHYKLGVALDREGRLKEAACRYRRALEINPGYTEAKDGLDGLQDKDAETSSGQ